MPQVCRSVVVAVVVAMTVTGCGGDDAADRVDGYVREANAIQADAAPLLAEVGKTYRDFSAGDLKGQEAVQRLVTAEAAIDELRRDIAELDPPAEARRLHELLLRLLAADVAFAGEIRQLATYVPAARSELLALDRIRRQLSRDLRAGREPTEQAGALNRYATALGSRLSRLRDLAPPPVLAPSAKRQIVRLDDARRLANRLADALAAANAERVARLLSRFRRTGGEDPEADRLTRAAFAGYQLRRQRINELAAEVQKERQRAAE